MGDDASERRWSDEELRHLSGLRELQICVLRAAGGCGPWTPIWVVVVDAGVYVRTWRRRETGWYGQARRSSSARIRVSGVPLDVSVTAVAGDRSDAVNEAYLGKYGAAGARSMVTAEAVATTLRLAPAGAAGGDRPQSSLG
ncbi:DUF2255 family protein [Microbacter sp. GSS18]|nr:DUF2255 family protein [Microbacter sp. GSS18]